MAKQLETAELHAGALPLIEELCAAGARFLLLTGSKPHNKGIYEEDPVVSEECGEWLSVPGKERGLAIEPHSLSLAALDFDGEIKPGKAHPDAIRAQVDAAISQFGPPALAIESRSGKTTGKTHLWYGFDAEDAPLGRHPDGRPRMLLTSTKTHPYYFDETGPGSASSVDIRCYRSMIIFPSLLASAPDGGEHGVKYLRGLAAIVRHRAEGGDTPPPDPSWETVIEETLNACWMKGRKKPPAPPQRSPRPTDAADVDLHKLREYNETRASRYQWEIGHRYPSANGLGYCAGMEWRWNPQAEALYREIVAMRAPEKYAADFAKGYEQGKASGKRPVPWDFLLTREALARLRNEQIEADAKLRDAAVAEAAAKESKDAGEEADDPAFAWETQWLKDVADRPLTLPPKLPNPLVVPNARDESFLRGLRHIGLEVRYSEMAAQAEFKCGGGWEPPDDASSPAWLGRFESCVQLQPDAKDKNDEPRDWTMSDQMWLRKIMAAGDGNRHNPAKDFVAEVKRRWKVWKRSPTSYLDGVLVDKDKFAAANTPLNRLAPFLMFGQTLMRSIRPGVRLRGATILIGGQKFGKSAFVESMLPEPWNVLLGQQFPLNGSGKEMWEAIRNFMIVEIADMQGASKAASSTLKRFVTATRDTGIRPTWGRQSINVPRWCTLIGTSDKRDCVPQDDADGRRGTRWVPVALAKRWHVEPWMEAHVWDLWCEAYDRIHNGEMPAVPDSLDKAHAALIRNHSVGYSLDTDIVYRQVVALMHGEAEYLDDDSAQAYVGEEGEPFEMRPGDAILSSDLQRLTIIARELFDGRNPDHAKVSKLGRALVKSGMFEDKRPERVASRIGGKTGRGYTLAEVEAPAKPPVPERKDASRSRSKPDTCDDPDAYDSEWIDEARKEHAKQSRRKRGKRK